MVIPIRLSDQRAPFTAIGEVASDRGTGQDRFSPRAPRPGEGGRYANITRGEATSSSTDILTGVTSSLNGREERQYGADTSFDVGSTGEIGPCPRSRERSQLHS